MKLLVAILLLSARVAAASKTIYHIAVQGSTQISCKITHKATKAEPYLLMTCEYRCDRPVVGATVDVKADHENIYCRGVEGSTPAAQGQPLDTEAPETTETIETKEN